MEMLLNLFALCGMATINLFGINANPLPGSGQSISGFFRCLESALDLGEITFFI